jgi:tetratricopeptide (TPR) repeat protein
MAVLRVAALFLLIVATGYSLDRYALRPLHCVHTASVGTATLGTMTIRDNRTQPLARRVRAELEGCDCVSPPDAAIPIALASAAEATADLPAAIAEYERALLIDRRPEIYFQLGLLQLDSRDHSAGIEHIVRACAFDPARLSDVPYAEVRWETEQRLRATYGPHWIH